MKNTDHREDLDQEAADWGVSVAEYTAAVSVVAEALQSATHLVTPAEADLLREDLLAYLFGSPEGRASLRAVLERPAPDESGDVAREGVVVDVAVAPKRGGQKA